MRKIYVARLPRPLLVQQATIAPVSYHTKHRSQISTSAVEQEEGTHHRIPINPAIRRTLLLHLVVERFVLDSRAAVFRHLVVCEPFTTEQEGAYFRPTCWGMRVSGMRTGETGERVRTALCDVADGCG
jgi:hypothetical protein